jgi:2-methylisocitrate lyase-like PEP mutase family enzyme
MKKSTMLRKILKEPGLLVAPHAFDCNTAACIEEVGFKAMFMCTAGIRNTEFGFPYGLITATEAITSLRNMMNSIHLPLIFDMEDGFGGALSAYRTAQDIIRLGVAGIFLNDQKHPYKGPGLAIQEVIPRDEYLGKIGAVLEARDKEDKDVVVVARIEAGSTLGDEEVVARAKACLKLGVDVILPQARLPKSKFGLRSKEEIRQLYKAIGTPKVWIWAIAGQGAAADFTAKDWEDIGAKIWAPGPLNGALMKLALELLQVLHDTGTIKGYHPQGGPSADFLHRLEGLDFWEGLEKKYVP